MGPQARLGGGNLSTTCNAMPSRRRDSLSAAAGDSASAFDEPAGGGIHSSTASHSKLSFEHIPSRSCLSGGPLRPPDLRDTAHATLTYVTARLRPSSLRELLGILSISARSFFAKF